MKKVLISVCCIALLAALLVGCGNGTVTTSVSPQYADDFARAYASKVSTDENGNVSYEFTDDSYQQFLDDYAEEVKEEAREPLKEKEDADPKKAYGQYSYFNKDMTEIIFGIEPDCYDEKECKAEAQVLGKTALKYQMNTQNPQGSIDVTYENCNTGDDYFTITVKAE